jgi:hypothetical protein
MNCCLKVAVAAFILAVGFVGSITAEPLEDGVAAHGRGDYATAMLLLRPLADHGNAVAQFNLGVMYLTGRGVAHDYAAAVNWFRKAADQGDANARYWLGGMYHRGLGVPRDDAAAASWYQKAADQGFAAARMALTDLERPRMDRIYQTRWPARITWAEPMGPYDEVIGYAETAGICLAVVAVLIGARMIMQMGGRCADLKCHLSPERPP